MNSQKLKKDVRDFVKRYANQEFFILMNKIIKNNYIIFKVFVKFINVKSNIIYSKFYLNSIN